MFLTFYRAVDEANGDGLGLKRARRRIRASRHLNERERRELLEHARFVPAKCPVAALGEAHGASARGFPAGDRLRLIQTQPASRTVQDQLVALGFEGSVLKRPGSAYRPDRPTRGWDDQWNDDHGQPRDRATD